MTYLEFKEIKDTGKTKVWDVNSVMSNVQLGTIAWFPSWRKYCFFPNFETIYDASCLAEIVEFIQKEMDKRK